MESLLSLSEQIINQMRQEILEQHPPLKSLGWFWWIRGMGTKTKITWTETKSTHTLKISFVAVQIYGKDYWVRWEEVHYQSIPSQEHEVTGDI